MVNSSLPQHPYGLRYFLLWLGAWAMRLPVFLGLWMDQNKSLQRIPSDVSRKRITIPSRDKGRSIAVDVYSKKTQPPRGTKSYVHINFHGSGFVIPSLGADIDFCAQLASSSQNITVFDTDYRKAPEHPFPAAYQDSEDVLKYIQSHPEDFDITHITVGGFSAGANLAMTLAVNSHPLSNTCRITGLTSFYGNTDMTTQHSPPNPHKYDNGIILPDWARTFFYNCLILPSQDRKDPRLSPSFASPLSKWPEHVLFVCGDADSLFESERIMAEKLKRDGGQDGKGHGDVEFMGVEFEAHGFDKGVFGGGGEGKRKSREKTERCYQRAFELIERAHR